MKNKVGSRRGSQEIASNEGVSTTLDVKKVCTEEMRVCTKQLVGSREVRRGRRGGEVGVQIRGGGEVGGSGDKK
ncbi:hypothetical protein PMAC_000464 [Pneumocystis sp. 'macacae']|nr:hypothetical protein PMAC_000467 [Pneumocystis sp. 'macacae']KAG5518009.1 hypothetical protein PMAC_000464 [Pneumocystis sp. 'macacae']